MNDYKYPPIALFVLRAVGVEVTASIVASVRAITPHYPMDPSPDRLISGKVSEIRYVFPHVGKKGSTVWKPPMCDGRLTGI